MTRERYHRWSAEDDELIERLIGEHTTAYIARRMGLVETQINNRIAKLGLSRKRDGVYSVNELMRLLSTDHKLVRLWIDDGTLRGRRIAGRGRYGQYEVLERDLIAFLREHAHLVDKRDVDAAYQQYVSDRWVTLGEAFHRGAAHLVSLEHACLAGTIPEARKRGVRWVIPESIVGRLVEGRRRWTSDPVHRRQMHLYDSMQRRQVIHRTGVSKSLWRAKEAS